MLLRRILLLASVLLLQACASVLGTVAGTGDQALPRQIERLKSDPAPLEAARYIFIGAAMNGREAVFDADVRLVNEKLSARYGSAYRSVLLSNQRIKSGDRDLPLASIDQLDELFDALETIKRPQDRFIVLLDSHGLPGLIEVEQEALYRSPRLINGKKIAAWMDQLAPNRSWLLISACFSGSHLPQLYQSHLLTMTAASARRPSFGCSSEFKNTWFIHELAESMDSTRSFHELWQQTRSRIGLREGKMKLPSSDPQLKLGSDWTDSKGMNEDWSRF